MQTKVEDTATISPDTPMAMLTLGQLLDNLPLNTRASEPKEEKRFLHSLQELADFLKVSYQTVARMKSRGELDDCISQGGRWMVIDANAVLDKYLLCNRRKKSRCNTAQS